MKQYLTGFLLPLAGAGLMILFFLILWGFGKALNETPLVDPYGHSVGELLPIAAWSIGIIFGMVCVVLLAVVGGLIIASTLLLITVSTGERLADMQADGPRWLALDRMARGSYTLAGAMLALVLVSVMFLENFPFSTGLTIMTASIVLVFALFVGNGLSEARRLSLQIGG